MTFRLPEWYSHLQSQVKSCQQMMVFMPRVLVWQRHKYHHLSTTLHSTLQMTIAQVVEMSVTNNSLSKDYPQLDDHTKQITDTKLFTFLSFLRSQKPSKGLVTKMLSNDKNLSEWDCCTSRICSFEWQLMHFLTTASPHRPKSRPRIFPSSFIQCI